jgi:small-conductance mechanosensitive channel
MNQLLEYELLHIGGYSLSIARVLGVFLVWLLTWLLLRAAHRVLHRSERIRSLSDKGRRHSLFLLVQYLGWTIAVASMLELLGIHVSVLLAGSAALLVGLGLGVQQIFRDIMSGIFLLFEGTIEVGDVLQVDGTVGLVEEINLRTSKLRTRDGLTIIVPNYKFITETVINWSHHEQAPSRFSVVFGVNYAADEHLVRQLALACAEEHPDVLRGAEHGPDLRLSDMDADEKMHFELLFWTHQKFEVEAVRSQLRFAIRAKLVAASIIMQKDV